MEYVKRFDVRIERYQMFRCIFYARYLSFGVPNNDRKSDVPSIPWLIEDLFDDISGNNMVVRSCPSYSNSAKKMKRHGIVKLSLG